MIQTVENAGGAIFWAPSSMACRNGLPMATFRCIFSISTVASSTKTPTASARSPSVMILIFSPSTLRSRSEVTIDSGMEMQMISVLRLAPRNTRIMIEVSVAEIRPSRPTPSSEAFTKMDWSAIGRITNSGGRVPDQD
jgi:hypothetical protein